MSAQLRTTEIGGVALSWYESGTGPSVVLVPGIPTDGRAFADLQRSTEGTFLSRSVNRRSAAINGSAGAVSGSTVEANKADIAGLIERWDGRPVHLLGHSYGGFIAAWLASQEPARIRSLVLVEPAIASLLLRDPSSIAQQLALLFRAPRVALSARRFLRDYNRPGLRALQDRRPQEAVRLNVDGVEDRPGAYDGYPATVRAMMTENADMTAETALPYPELRASGLSKIRAPTLVLHGTSSAAWLREIARRTAQAIPGAELRAISGAGHFPHLSAPEEFARVVSAFWANIP